MLLLLQNRGRMTSAQLARELEVARRTIQRDLDAITEAGLPVVVHRGNRGGVELGFNYRTRLTGLTADEAEAVAVILSKPVPELDVLGLATSAARARAKVFESFPDGVRERVALARGWFRFGPAPAAVGDQRIEAMAQAIRRRAIVRIRVRSEHPHTIRPIALVRRARTWAVIDQGDPELPIALVDWGDINVSSRSF